MKERKKIKFNPKSGMAVPAVLIILMILSVLGTAMYAYSMQSLKSVRYASDTKKAEYLAKAGVESAAFAYQQATNKTGTNQSVQNFFGAVNSNANSKIESNKVYLIWYNNDYMYVLESQLGDYGFSKDTAIGYFIVRVSEMTKSQTIEVRNYNSDGSLNGDPEPRTITSGIKIFNSTGYVHDTSCTRSAYIDDVTLCSDKYYGPDGVVDGKYTDGNGQNGSHKEPLNHASVPFMQSGSFKTNGTIQWRWKWLSSWFPSIFSDPDPQNVTSETVPYALAYSGGNLIVDKPTPATTTNEFKDDESIMTLSFQKNQSNFVSFVGMNNLFVQANIDATADNGHFNSVYLKGKEIVIDGNIDLSAYGFTRKNTGLLGNLGQLNDFLQEKYTYGTVTIAGTDDTNNKDNLYKEIPYKFTRSGKVYFGGNVYVNITMPNVGTYRYKAFSAGDVYYFDAAYQSTRSGLLNIDDNTSEDSNYGGIDLFRFFLEYSIATNRYSTNVLGRFSDLIDFYYQGQGDGSTLVTDNGVATRAYVRYNIDSNGLSTGNLLYCAMRKVDNTEGNDYGDSLASIIPPNPGDASALRWGKPTTAEETTTAAVTTTTPAG